MVFFPPFELEFGLAMAESLMREMLVYSKKSETRCEIAMGSESGLSLCFLGT